MGTRHGRQSAWWLEGVWEGVWERAGVRVGGGGECYHALLGPLYALCHNNPDCTTALPCPFGG